MVGLSAVALPILLRMSGTDRRQDPLQGIQTEVPSRRVSIASITCVGEYGDVASSVTSLLEGAGFRQVNWMSPLTIVGWYPRYFLNWGADREMVGLLDRIGASSYRVRLICRPRHSRELTDFGISRQLMRRVTSRATDSVEEQPYTAH